MIMQFYFEKSQGLSES